MKLIVTGATGFVGKEIIRQSLRIPEITELVAVARKAVTPPDSKLYPDSDSSKLRSVVVSDYGEYTDEVKKEFQGADACIWTVAITPSKSKTYDWNEVVRVCHECTMTGLKAMVDSRGEKQTPFRFLYMSGAAAERDQTKKPSLMAQYALMRGQVENEVLAFAASSNGKVEVTCAKPGMIKEPGDYLKAISAFALKAVAGFPSITTAECSAGMLDQVLDGFTKEPLTNADLVELAQKMLKKTEG